MRKDYAIKEYTFVQKGIMREKLKDRFLTLQQKELYENFDCVPTPAMDDFDIIHSDRMALV